VRTEPKNEPPAAVKPPSSTPPRPRCLDCGTVKDIRKVTQTPASTTTTAAQKPPVLGGIVGGVLSRPSTQIQEEYEVLIQLLSGKQVLVLQKILSTGLKVGSKVRVSQGRILAVSP
jgi:outer membrane lipoprotein SlyB